MTHVLAAGTNTDSIAVESVFWILAVAAVAAALAMILVPRAVHCALMLAVVMLCLATMYAMQGAPFLAFVQIIVYTGAVLMLFLFVVMLIGVNSAESLTETIRVAVPERSVRHDLRAVSIVWRRELIRFRTDRLRAITSLVQPVLFLFVLGTGLSRLASHGLPTGVDFKTFIYPGVLAMSVLFTSIFSAASIVWDREFGFLREMLVAPVRRWAIVVGKCLGGATVATFQGLIFLALAGVAHVPYDPLLLLTLVGELLLLSFTLTAFGVMMAARIKQIQAFMALTQLFVLPLFFLSGALYPLNGLPAWLTVLTRIDPLTYIVDPMRSAVFAHLPVSPLAVHTLSPGITWFGWVVPLGLSLAIVAFMGAAMLAIAIAEFRKTE